MPFHIKPLLFSIFKTHKEILLYLFFGGLTFIISIGSYSLLNVVLHINLLIANILSWILAVSFAYVTNKKWVFKPSALSSSNMYKEIITFFNGRVITLLIEEILLFIFITVLAFNSIIIKSITQILVIILNYIISKTIVFR